MSKHSLPVIISFSLLLARIQAAVITAPLPYETSSLVPLHHKPLDLQPIDPLYGRVRKEAGPVGRAAAPTSTHAPVHTPTSGDEESEGEDDMKYFSEFLGLFSSVRLLHGEFTVAEKHKTALRGGGMPVPGIVTPRPEVTVVEKRESPGGETVAAAAAAPADKLTLGEEAEEVDDMFYFSEFLDFFSSAKLLHGEFATPAKYKTSLRGGLPVPGVVTHSPVVTVAAHVVEKRGVEEAAQVTVVGQEEEEEEDPMVYYTEFMSWFSDIKGLHTEFTNPGKYKTAVRDGLPMPGIHTPKPEVTIAAVAKRNVGDDTKCAEMGDEVVSTSLHVGSGC